MCLGDEPIVDLARPRRRRPRGTLTSGQIAAKVSSAMTWRGGAAAGGRSNHASMPVSSWRASPVARASA
jgi:hypothetical protein